MSTALWPSLWLWLPLCCEELDVKVSARVRLERGIWWIYGVKLLTLITETFSLLTTEMSALDCICFIHFFPNHSEKNWVVFLGSAIIAECSTPEPWLNILAAGGWNKFSFFFSSQGQPGSRGEPGLPGDRGPAGEGKVGQTVRTPRHSDPFDLQITGNPSKLATECC